MNRKPIVVFSLLAMTAFLCKAEDARIRTAVLLELFTSEGCSSCPLADRLLTKIDREQPINDVDLVVLSEHVDYWNDGGWRDPYSSSIFSERQQHYASRLGNDDIYTPQLVVDGATQLVGSNWANARTAIERARQKRKFVISLTTVPAASGRKFSAHISADPLLPVGEVYLVIAEDTREARVKAGENSGLHLSDTAVAESVMKIGKITRNSAFEKTLDAPVLSKWGGAARIVVFVQDPVSGRILGVSSAKL